MAYELLSSSRKLNKRGVLIRAEGLEKILFWKANKRGGGRLLGTQEYGLSTIILSEVISIFRLKIVTGTFCRLQK